MFSPAENLKRLFQWIICSSLFDLPFFYWLRNTILRGIFKAGRGLTVGHSCRFIQADFHFPPAPEGRLRIGENVAINHHTEIDYSGGVTIEDEVWISQNVLIETHAHAVSGLPKSQWAVRRSPLVIKRDAWIGANAVIMASAREIGEGAIVGAGAVVVHDVPAWSIVGGVPARLIKKRK